MHIPRVAPIVVVSVPAATSPATDRGRRHDVQFVDDDGATVIILRLTEEETELVRRALDHAGDGVSKADAMVLMAESYLANDDACRSGSDRALLVVNTDEQVLTGEDPDALTITPGIGKRGAQKIVLELGPKLTGRETEVIGGRSLGGVRQALEGLGYSTAEINAVVADLDPNDTIEAQVKSALQRLGKR